MIRLSGPATAEVLAATVPGAPAARGAGAGRLRLGAGRDLPVLVMRFAGPASYTGEDAAEILLPGNPHLVERVMDVLLGFAGVRRAGPGEFTARAFLNGRMTLDEAEGVAALVAARNDAEVEAAGRLLAGAAGAEHRAWADEVATLLALVEAGIDFSDQESVVPISREELARRVSAMAGAIGARLGASAGRESRREFARIVLVGEPNAGKSTLFNALLGRGRAVVSPVAGTTRDVLEEELDLSREAPGAGCVLLCDSAGLDARAEREGGMAQHVAQAAAKSAAAGADALLWCDPSGRFDEACLPAVAGGRAACVIRVRTKGDLPGVAARKGGPGEDLAVCALDGWNLGALRRAIADAGADAGSSGAAGVIPRHRRALAEAREHLGRVPESAGLETAAASLRLALNALGDITGRIAPDEVIGRIFATFCVGK